MKSGQSCSFTKVQAIFATCLSALLWCAIKALSAWRHFRQVKLCEGSLGVKGIFYHPWNERNTWDTCVCVHKICRLRWLQYVQNIGCRMRSWYKFPPITLTLIAITFHGCFAKLRNVATKGSAKEMQANKHGPTSDIPPESRLHDEILKPFVNHATLCWNSTNEICLECSWNPG